MEGYSASEYIAILLARELQDGDLAAAGRYSEIGVAACLLAQKLQAPNLKIAWGGCFRANLFGIDAPLLSWHTQDYRHIIYAESLSEHDIVLFLGNRERPPIDVFFVSGIQIDKYGNTNLVCLGDYSSPRLRGPGSAGMTSCTAMVKRYYLFFSNHSKNNFVERVDFVSGPGYIDGPKSRRTLGLPGGGPQLVITPFCVMDFHPHTGTMQLKSLHPTIPLEKILDSTGFELIIPENIPTTAPPKDEELELLRREIDPQGLLRRR